MRLGGHSTCSNYSIGSRLSVLSFWPYTAHDLEVLRVVPPHVDMFYPATATHSSRSCNQGTLAPDASPSADWMPEAAMVRLPLPHAPVDAVHDMHHAGCPGQPGWLVK